MQDGTVVLVTLRAPISNGALAGAEAGKLPERLKVLGWGDNPSVKGNVRLSELSASTVPGKQKELGFDRIALDFEHNTVPGSEEFARTSEPRPVAGYGVPRIVPGEGMFLESIEWTPEGKKSALNYADLSPAVQFDKAGNIVFVHSVALTRNGAVDGLSFFNVSIQKCMSDSNKQAADAANSVTVAELAPVVGLAATASKADVLGKLKDICGLTALSALLKEGKVVILDTVQAIDDRLKKVEEAGTKAIATLSATIDGKVVTLNAQDLVKLSSRIDGLETTLRQQSESTTELEKSNIIRLFSAEGKVPKDAAGKAYDAEGLKKLDVGTLRLLHANTPVTVPLNVRNRVQEGTGASGLKGRDRVIAALEAERK